VEKQEGQNALTVVGKKSGKRGFLVLCEIMGHWGERSGKCGTEKPDRGLGVLWRSA